MQKFQNYIIVKLSRFVAKLLKTAYYAFDNYSLESAFYLTIFTSQYFLSDANYSKIMYYYTARNRNPS